MSDYIDERDLDEPERGVIVVETAGLGRALDPGDIVALATRMADVLHDIVEKRNLFAVINKKKFPTVEAWMTIARMDNVVAREVPDGIAALDDGSYEATVELIRLSDGAIIGRGSALCGSPGDSPWDQRPKPQRRSMAVTRATSRAFRQQYSWIMALAGYEPTPAEEMQPDAKPIDSGGRGGGLVDGRSVPHPVAVGDMTAPWIEVADYSATGTVSIGTPPFDLELRPTPDGSYRFGFRFDAEGDPDHRIPQVLVEGQLAADIAEAQDGAGLIWTHPVTVLGDLYRVPWEKNHKPQKAFQRLLLKRLVTNEWTLPDP